MKTIFKNQAPRSICSISNDWNIDIILWIDVNDSVMVALSLSSLFLCHYKLLSDCFFRYSHFFRHLFAVFSIVDRRLCMNNKYSSSKQREHVYLINAKFISLLSLIMTVECINEFKLKSTECIFLPTNGENCITKENGVLIWFWYRSR